jgi:repressor LexA
MNELTPRQKQVLDFIGDRIRAEGFPPTVREIGRHFSIFPRAVQDHLDALERKGALTRTPDRARGMVPTKNPARERGRLPLLGRVPAGAPREAFIATDEFVTVDDGLAKKAQFALRVKGDSMSPHILDGDLVLVRGTPTADDGDIVVAGVEDGEATVKRLRRRGRETFLEAINPAYAPIRGGHITVVGRVTALIRPTIG